MSENNFNEVLNNLYVIVSFDKLNGMLDEIKSLNKMLQNLELDLDEKEEKIQDFDEYLNQKLPDITDELVRNLICIGLISKYSNITDLPAIKFKEVVSEMASAIKPAIESYFKS